MQPEDMTDPVDLALWRGHVSAKVDEFGRRIDVHDKDVRELRMGATATTLELARLGSSVEGLRGDISKALAEQAQNRRDEFLELQKVIGSRSMNGKERIAQIYIPLLVVFIIAIVTLVSAHVI